MILRVSNIGEFMSNVHGKKVVCYGAGKYLSRLSEEFNSRIETVYSYVVDRNEALWGDKREINGVTLDIYSPQKLFNEADSETVVLITVLDWIDVFEYLDGLTQLDNIECYCAPLLLDFEYYFIARGMSLPPSNWRMNTEMQIPKVIHYIWLGSERMSNQNMEYIKSWKKYCPDYEIVEWNSTNYDLTAHPFLLEAVKHKHWAAVSDYARLDIVYRNGGIYFDTDVEIIKNIDELLYNSAFIGYEQYGIVNTGSGFGARQNSSIIKSMRDEYNGLSFVLPDGNYDYRPCPVIQSQTLERLGFERNRGFQVVQEMAVYPIEYFSPKCWNTGYISCTSNTYSIHHYTGTWVDRLFKEKLNIKKKLVSAALLNKS